MYCRKCGKEIPDDSVFCPVCGAGQNNTGSTESTETISSAVNAAPEPDDTYCTESEPYSSSARLIPQEKPRKKKTAVFVVLGIVLAVLAGVFLFVILPEMHLDLEYRLSRKKDEYYITGYLGSGNEVVIPDTIWGKPVTYIKEKAFQGTDIKSVSTGLNVETIEKSAFQDCTELETVKPTKSGDTGHLKFIMENAFMNCTSLTEVELHSLMLVQKYDFQNNAFSGCVSLRSIDLSQVSEVGEYAFYNCASLRKIDYSNVEKFADSAIYGCSSLKRYNSHGANKLLGMSESSIRLNLGEEYDINYNEEGERIYTYSQYGLQIGVSLPSQCGCTSVVVQPGRSVSSELGWIDFVNVGMTFGEIFEYHKIVSDKSGYSPNIEFIASSSQAGGYYQYRYYVGEYDFYFTSSYCEHEVSDPENLVTTQCVVRLLPFDISKLLEQFE